MIFRFDDLLKIVKGSFICEVNGKRIAKKEIYADAYRNYEVVSIEIEGTELLIELKPPEISTPEFNSNDDWVKEHKKQFESEPSFF